MIGAPTVWVAGIVPPAPLQTVSVEAPERAWTIICSESIWMSTPQKIGSVDAELTVIVVWVMLVIAAERPEEQVQVDPIPIEPSQGE